MKEELLPTPLLQLITHYRSCGDIHDVFGIILYTVEHPYIVKILRDDDFWKALDAKSGKRWVIFSIRPEKGKTVMQLPKPIPGLIQMLVAIPEWREPAHNVELLSLLGLDDTQELPILLVFAQPTGGDLLRAIFKISGDTPEQAYASLERAVTAASNAIKNVTAENIKNTFEIFNLVDSAATQEVTLQRFKSVLRLIPYAEKIQKILSGSE